MNTSAFRFAIIVLLLITSTAGAQGQLALIDDQKAILLLDKKLVEIDLASAATTDLGRADGFAFDPSTQSLLTARFTEKGTLLRLSTLGGGPDSVTENLLQLRVVALSWTGVSRQFCIMAIPANFKHGDIPFWIFYSLEPQTWKGKSNFAVEPIPGLSDVAIFIAGKPLINVKLNGCFAYSGVIAHPEVVLKNLAIKESSNDSSRTEFSFSMKDCYLVVAKDWMPWRAWRSPFPTSSRAIAFSGDGSHVLVSVYPVGLAFLNVDLNTGRQKLCPWLSSAVDILAVDGNLSSAVVSVGPIDPPNNTPPTTEPDLTWLPKFQEMGGPSDTPSIGPEVSLWKQAKAISKADSQKTPGCILGLIGESQSPALLRSFDTEPELACATAGHGIFWLSDGHFLWKIAGSHIADEKRLKASN